MEAMDERRHSIYRRLVPKFEDEELARDLVLALPAKADELVTKEYLDLRLVALEQGVKASVKDDLNRVSWRLITAMGVWTAIAASLFGWLSRVAG